MRIKDWGTFCDFCAFEQPAFTYDLPKDFALIAGLEIATGDVEVMKSASSLICACVACAKIIASSIKVGKVKRLARRIFDTNPKLRMMGGEAREIAYKGGVKIWGRWLRHLRNRRSFVDGECKFQGLSIRDVPTHGRENLN